MAREPRVLGIVLAGGEGKRLFPLTADRAKPAVPFGGNYRLIDFVLSNLVNAKYLRICVLTQYKSHSLDRHITTTWRMSTALGDYITPVPAQQRLGPRWYTGSADAILQSANLIYDDKPDYIIVFGADHVYRMDPRQMVQQHLDSGAGATVAGIRVPRAEATAFGVIDADPDRRVIDFLEKPAEPPGLPDNPDQSYASMGNYVFTTDALLEALKEDAGDEQSVHDMGTNIMPMMVKKGDAYVYDFADNDVPGAEDRDHGYWRDVGSIDAYYDAHMDLVAVHPIFNLYNQRWPIYTHHPQLPPAKFVEGGIAQESMVGSGAIVAGATVRHSIIASNVRLAAGAYVEGSVLMDGVQIGRGAVVRRAILDKDVVVPEGAHIGLEPDLDRSRYHVSEGGIVVLGKNQLALPLTVGVGWDAAPLVARWPGLAPLAGDTRADACVVGLGASGLAAVEALVGRGLSVVGLDAGRVAAGAAGRNGGFLLGGGELALHRAIAEWGDVAVELYRETLTEIDALEATLPPGVLRRTGSIRLAGLPGPPVGAAEDADRQDEVADCAAQALALREHGIAVEDYDGPLGRGIFLPDDAAVNPAVRALSIASRLEHRAALHEHTPVSRVDAGAVTTAHGTVHAPVVIVAVDGRLDRLLPRLAGRVRTARLQMLATAPVAPVAPCLDGPVYGRWGYDYAQQGDDGRLYVGGGRDHALEAEWTDSAEPTAPVQAWIEQVAARMAGGPVRVEDRWAASAGFTPDARPLCIRLDEGVVAVGGYNGTGNLVGPVAARAAVAYALDGTRPPGYLAS